MTTPKPVAAIGTGPSDAAQRVAIYARVTKGIAVEGAADLALLGSLDLDSSVVVTELEKHHLPSLFGLNSSPASLDALPERIARNIQERTAARKRRLESLLVTYDGIHEAFGAAGIEFLCFKGFHLGDRFYAAASRRPQFDLDLLIHERDRRRAERLLRARGFLRTARDEHSVSYQKDASEIDLHWRLRHCPAYQLDHAAVWASRVPHEFGERRFFTLSDEHLVALLSLSIVHDLERGCCKVKQLLDLYLVCRAVDAAFDWTGFVARRRRENLDGLCLTGLSVVLLVFEARSELPRLAATLLDHRERLGVRDRDHALHLLSREKGDVDSKLWFLGVYPGSALEYRAWLAYQQFPGILLRFRPRWLLEIPRLALGALRSDRASRSAGGALQPRKR